MSPAPPRPSFRYRATNCSNGWLRAGPAGWGASAGRLPTTTTAAATMTPASAAAYEDLMTSPPFRECATVLPVGQTQVKRDSTRRSIFARRPARREPAVRRQRQRPPRRPAHPLSVERLVQRRQRLADDPIHPADHRIEP